MAAAEIGHLDLLTKHLAANGVAVEDAMAPFVSQVDAWHGSTRPKSWLESLVKAYVGDGLAADLYREIASWLDPETKDLVLTVLADTGHSAFAEREVAAGIKADPKARDKLALWGHAAARRGAHPGAIRGGRARWPGRTDRRRVR